MPDITKLKLAGYFTVMSLQLKHPKALKQIKGFSEAKVEKVLEAARKLTQGSSSFSTASAYLESRQDIFAINTGARELNEIIGGGLESQQLTEVSLGLPRKRNEKYDGTNSMYLCPLNRSMVNTAQAKHSCA